MGEQQRIVAMTGATAGIGAHALEHISHDPNTMVILGARGEGRAVPSDVHVLPLDLASLKSVREFAAQVIEKIDGQNIDVLVLNAGMQTSKNDRRSAEGFELTFAVNHLAHYLLARLLIPRIGEGGRLIITTSETHDPKITPIAPKVLDTQELAHPSKGGFGTGIRAYAASKLCNLMTAQYFAASKEIRERKISVCAFSPGLTGGTSLGRDSSPLAKAVVTLLMHTVFRLVGLFKHEYVIGTPERAGEALADVVFGKVTPPNGRIYLSLVKGQPKFPDPSDLSRSRETQKRLWRESAAMVGLSEEG